MRVTSPGLMKQAGSIASAGFEPMAWLTSVSDRKSTRLNSSHMSISYAVFCLKKKKRDLVALRAREDHHVGARRARDGNFDESTFYECEDGLRPGKLHRGSDRREQSIAAARNS